MLPNKQDTNVQFLVWCWVLGRGVSTEMPLGLPFHTGQAQFQPGLLQPVLHFSNSKTEKWARAFYTGSQSSGRQSAPGSTPSRTPGSTPLTNRVSSSRQVAPVPLDFTVNSPYPEGQEPPALGLPSRFKTSRISASFKPIFRKAKKDHLLTSATSGEPTSLRVLVLRLCVPLVTHRL